MFKNMCKEPDHNGLLFFIRIVVSLQMVRSGALLMRTRCPVSAELVSGVGPPHLHTCPVRPVGSQGSNLPRHDTTLAVAVLHGCLSSRYVAHLLCLERSKAAGRRSAATEACKVRPQDHQG